MKAAILILIIVIVINASKWKKRLSRIENNSNRTGSKTTQTTTIKVKLPDPEKLKQAEYKQLQRDRKEKEYKTRQLEKLQQLKVNASIAYDNNITIQETINDLMKQFNYYESIEKDKTKQDKTRIAAQNKKIQVSKKIQDLASKQKKNELIIYQLHNNNYGPV